MNKADIEFTVGLNTSPAEQQLDRLYEKMRKPVTNNSSPLLQQIANEYSQGFKMVGTPYDSGSNRFGVPSTQVLNTALATTAQTIQRFNAVVNTVIQMSTTSLDAYFKRISQPRIEYNGGGSFTPFTNKSYRPMEAQFHRNFWYDKYNINSPLDTKLLTYDKAFDMVGDSYMKMYPEVWTNSQYASGAYQMWQKTFNTNNILGLPAPKEIQSEDNQPPEEQSKDIVEQDKKDNDELKDKLMLWGKIAATIYAIRKVLQGLAKIWKFGAETVSGVNGNLNEEAGYFSTDPEGALRANSDKTRAMLYAGIRNMGENAPVSKAGMDYATTKITEMWTAAMSGRNVDSRTAIDAQRLKDFFGIDMTVAGLLTGEREGKTATDIQIDMMNKVEEQISKLAETDEVTKGQIIDSLKNILGDELVDAIVANANKNLKIENPELKINLSEILLNHGGSAIPSGNLTEATAQSVDAISELNESLQKLKNTIVVELSPAFSAVTKVMSKFVDWVNEKLTKVQGEKNALGEIRSRVSIASLTSGEVSRYSQYKKLQKEDDTKDTYDKKGGKDKLIREYLKSGDPNKVLDALYLSQPQLKSAADVENLVMKQQESNIAEAFKDEYFDPNSKNPIIRALANYTYGGEKGFEAFKLQLGTEEGLSWGLDDVNMLFNNQYKMDESARLLAVRNFVRLNPEAKKAFGAAFDKGGAYDFGTDMGIFKYLYNIKNFSSVAEQYDALQTLSKEARKVLDNTVDMEPVWNDKNKNGVMDLGEVYVTLVVKNQYGETLVNKDISKELQ